MKGFVKENSEEEEMKKQEDVEQEQNEPKKSKKEKKEEKKLAKQNKNEKEKKQKNKKENKQEEKQENKEDKKFEQAKQKSKKIEKQMQEMIEKRKRRWILVTVIAVVIVIAIFLSTIFALVNINNEKIFSGISISGIDVSGLTKEEATAKINDIYQEKKEKEIGIQYEDYETTLNPTLMEVNYDVENAVEQAFLIGKNENIFINNYNILFTLIAKKNIPVNMTLNEDVAKQTINDIGVNLPGVIIESSHAIEEDELIITKGKAGVVIQTDQLLNLVKDNLNDINTNEDDIIIPVEQKEPDPIDIDKIHEEVYTEAKDAYYTKDPFTVYPEVEGIDFDVEAAREMLKEDKEEYVIPLKITKPKITLDQIGSEAFPDKLSTFTTRYDVSDVDRSTNLVIACQKINGKVVLAGDTFSYNKALGPRTASAGYRNGKIYSGGEVVDGIGGGICQISSTLYNTVLMANLQIVERRNHQFVTSYLPAGRDATVVYGATDFKFKNTRKYPVRIQASAKNGIATISIYGIKEENEYTFSFSTRTVASIPFTTKYEEDASLSAGTEKIKQKGANGLKTETYITKMLNGKVVSTTLLSRDTYDAMARIVIRGTKQDGGNNNNNSNSTQTKPAVPETQTQPTTPTTPSETEQEPTETPGTDTSGTNP